MPTSLSYDGRIKPYAQKLRKSMTKQVRHLWYDFLKSYPVQFRRQKQFGYCIGDFYCADAKLVVELDGSQHYDPEGKQYDRERDAYLRSLDLAVLRFSNSDVNERFESVCLAIDQAVHEKLADRPEQ